MAGHTILNLKRDVEDAAATFGLAPDLEARFPGSALEADAFALSYQRLAPNYRLPFGHRHHRQEEVYVVVAGSGRVRLEDEVVDVGQWDAVRVANETTRCFEAGPDGLELLAFGAPKTPPGDAEQVPGWWGD